VRPGSRQGHTRAGEEHDRLVAVTEGVDVHLPTGDVDQLAVGVHAGAFTRAQRPVDEGSDDVGPAR
jgi:hypothetical protein